MKIDLMRGVCKKCGSEKHLLDFWFQNRRPLQICKDCYPKRWNIVHYR